MEPKQQHSNQKKRLYRGTVVSDVMQKTVTVVVETTYRHAQFGKILRHNKKYKVHDEHNTAKKGDIIEFFSGRPLSKTKYMYMTRVISETNKTQ